MTNTTNDQVKKMSEWIKCSDRMPELRKTYSRYCSARVIVNTESIGIQFGELEHSGQWSVAGYQHRDVTHWQPLPAPPTE